MTELKIQVEGLEKVMAALTKFPRQIGIYLGRAGGEAAHRVIFPTRGLQKYPPSTAANQPPTPYYIRGRGTMTSHGLRATSERLGTQWYTKRTGYGLEHTTEIGNRASYAKWVHSEQQAQAMGRIGWRKIGDVAKEKLGNIKRVYDAWVAKLIRDLGL